MVNRPSPGELPTPRLCYHRRERPPRNGDEHPQLVWMTRPQRQAVYKVMRPICHDIHRLPQTSSGDAIEAMPDNTARSFDGCWDIVEGEILVCFLSSALKLAQELRRGHHKKTDTLLSNVL